MDRSMSHSEYEELAAGYVLGALEPDDEHAFQRHLGGCQLCEANVRELEGVVGELAFAAPPAEPPDTVWAGVRRQIRPEAVRRSALSAPGAGLGAGGRGARLLPVLAAAAAIVLVVVLSLWNLNLRDQNAIYRDRLAALEHATGLANDPRAALVNLGGTSASAGAQATVIVSSPQDRGVLLVENLPRLEPGRVYELWCIPAGGSTSDAEKALVFVPLRRPGVQSLEFQMPIQPRTQWAITEEPGPDGSDKPTSQPLLAGAPRA